MPAFAAVLEAAAGIRTWDPLYVLENILAGGGEISGSQGGPDGREGTLHEPLVFAVEHVYTITQADELQHMR